MSGSDGVKYFSAIDWVGRRDSSYVELEKNLKREQPREKEKKPRRVVRGGKIFEEKQEKTRHAGENIIIMGRHGIYKKGGENVR